MKSKQVTLPQCLENFTRDKPLHTLSPWQQPHWLQNITWAKWKHGVGGNQACRRYSCEQPENRVPVEPHISVDTASEEIYTKWSERYELHVHDVPCINCTRVLRAGNIKCHKNITFVNIATTIKEN